MVFSSIVFLFYFLPVFFFFYYLADARYKNAVILAGSIFFYAWGAPRFVFVLLGTTIIDFFIVRGMDKSAGAIRRKLLLVCSLSLNLGLLFYFKYSHFFIGNINALLSTARVKPVAWTAVILPIGISFYTFETVTYVVDVYRRVHRPLRNFRDYQTYIILFPKLIAGPIVRYHDIAGQLHDRAAFETSEYRLRGLYRFCLGLGKKVLIANTLGAEADVIFGAAANTVSTYMAWMGALSYTFQIYFDFSGYSDMAIGLCMMMGFRLPENFNNPYTATSITDFWRRWHMTLGAWMRNYLYIPLGGNRVGSKRRLYFNLWLVFLASGLWHGAAWGFVIWGAYHGFFLVIERAWLGKWLVKLGRLSVLYSFLVVLLGWVCFRLEHITPALQYWKRMFTWHRDAHVWAPAADYGFFLLLAVFFSVFTLLPGGRRVQELVYDLPYNLKRHCLMAFLCLLLFVICAGRITIATFNPFIYFRF